MKFFIDHPQKIAEYGENAYDFIKERDFSHQVQQLTALYHAPLTVKYHKNPLLVACMGDEIDEKVQEKMHQARLEHPNIMFVPQAWLAEDMKPYAMQWSFNDDLVLPAKGI